MNQKTLDLLALSLSPGLGTIRLNRLLMRIGGPAEILSLSARHLARLGLSAETRVYIKNGCARRDAENVVEYVEKHGIELLSPFEEHYPMLLKEIADPPAILYCQGDVRTLSKCSVAVVGSRHCTVYGRGVARKLSRELAELGLNIVSGMARGIDAESHRGALEAGGTTVAVFGTGIDIVYPREHKKLCEKIRENGCVVTEFPLGSFPAPQNFPIRNRLISGLSLGTLIPEAKEFSGSLITARLTLEQNRELWAVPGNITNPGSYGPNYLVKQGATPVITVQDVLDELPLHVLEELISDQNTPDPDSTKPGSSTEEDELLSILPEDSAVHFDRLLELTASSISELSVRLLELEMKGIVKQWPGRRYSREM